MAKRHRPKASELYELTRQDGELFHDDRRRPVALPAASAPLADTHGHLTHFYQHDPAMVLARAALAGVALLGVPLDPADADGRDVAATLDAIDRWVDEASSLIDELVACGVRQPAHDPRLLLDNVYLWAGAHPYHAVAFNEDSSVQAAFQQLLQSRRTVGIGEFGLDYGPYNKVAPEDQHRAFEMQLRLAHEYGLPVELHIRDAEHDERALAHEEAVRVLEREGVPAAGCDLHCYTSNPEVMRPFVEMGCRVAFGGAATFPSSEDIREAAACCPSHLMLSETDSPYMAPMPLRGYECEPAMVAFSARLLSDVREEAGVASRAETYEALWSNARVFFGLGAELAD